MEAAPPDRLHRRAFRLELFTVAWNVAEAVVAVVAGLTAGGWRWSRSAWTPASR
jgi:hypothetical protein